MQSLNELSDCPLHGKGFDNSLFNHFRSTDTQARAPFEPLIGILARQNITFRLKKNIPRRNFINIMNGDTLIRSLRLHHRLMHALPYIPFPPYLGSNADECLLSYLDKRPESCETLKGSPPAR